MYLMTCQLNMLSTEERTQRSSLKTVFQKKGVSDDIKSAAICFHYAFNPQCLQQVEAALLCLIDYSAMRRRSQRPLTEKVSGW